MSEGLDFDRIARERPEKLEVEDVLATPCGGSAATLAAPRAEPLAVVIKGRHKTLIYRRWEDGAGEVAYWRHDVWVERFGIGRAA